MKNKIEKLVEQYTKLFPKEFEAFKNALAVQIDVQKDEFGTVKNSDTIKRKLGEIPETLFNILKMRLTDEEQEWFNSKEGTNWFIKKFKEFRTTKDV